MIPAGFRWLLFPALFLAVTDASARRRGYGVSAAPSRYSINSVYVSVMVAFGALFTSSLAGFAITRFRFAGRNFLFALLLSTMMIPIQVMIIPEFLIMLRLGWIDHPLFLPLIVPS